MDIKRIPIEQVVPWDKNPRGITTKDYARLKKQIAELGVYKPLIAVQENGKYVVLGGNMRIRVLKEMGLKEVDVSVVKAKTEAEKIKYSLSDNDRAGEYDDQALAELIYSAKDEIDSEMFKIDLGNSFSIEDLLTQFGPKIEAGEEDVVPEPKTEAKTKEGDLYELGPHRLLCGNATKPESYKALLEEKQADIVFTDPPYNVAYSGGQTKKFGPIIGDDMSEEQFVEFVINFITRMKENTKKGGIFYICSGYSSYPTFVYAFKAVGLIYSCPIIWVKNNTSLGWGDYRHKHEMILKVRKGHKKAQPILYGWNSGRHYFIDSRFEADVWEIARRGTQAMLHPTQKPLGLIQRALRNSSRPKEIVLDPFCGSGSTIIAAEREGRIAYAMDLDPIYVDVTIRRYAALGGPNEKEIRATRKKIEISEEKHE